MGNWGADLAVVFFCFHLFFGQKWVQAASRGPQVIIEVAQFDPKQTEDQVRSKIEFVSDGKVPKIRVADLSIPDSITFCPVDTMPADLATMVAELANKVSSLVSQIKDDHGERCAALSSHLQATQSQIGSAYQYQMVAASAISSNTNQDLINQQIQKASAISQMVLTTSDILQNCISKDALSDQQVIQKLIAQIVTLSGLFMGGWQGIAIATGGQVIGALPLFTGDIDNALKQFKHYNEMNERGSFLCYLRQIRKTSCLLFANEEDQFINGLDLSFKTGPVRTTIETLEQYRKENPATLEDLEMLRRIKLNSVKFMNAFTQVESLATRGASTSLSPLLKTTLDELGTLCKAVQPLRELIDSRLADSVIQREISELRSICSRETNIIAISFNRISDIYWQLYSINSYYQSIVKEENLEIGKIARTLESMKYFEELKKSVGQYADSNAGNQSRMHFLDLSRKLSKAMGISTFKALFKDDFEKFSGHSNYFTLINSKAQVNRKLEHEDVRGRALRAMIDLCMTFDPTLSCMEVGDPRVDPLFRTWMKYCVGPSSELCREPLVRGECAFFLQDKRYRTYFESLCGLKEKASQIPPVYRSPLNLRTPPENIHAR